MDDRQKDHEERAFSGHPDHPPRHADQPPQGNEELSRNRGESEDGDGGGEQPGKNPDDEWTNLPGYG